MKHYAIVAITLAVIFSGRAGLRAAVVASDNFESYAPGVLGAANGGSGWAGAWSASDGIFTSTIVTTTLTYSGGAVSSNGGIRALQLQWTGTSKETQTSPLIARQLSSSQTGTVYMSLLFRDTVDDQSAANDNFTQFGFDNTNDGNPNASILREAPFFGARGGTTGTTFSSVNSGVGGTFLLVFKAERLTANFDRISLFVNPTTLTEGTANAVDNDSAGTGALNWFMARSARHNPGDTFQIDNIMIGTTWTDVVVPEPSTGLLIGLASIGLLRRRRDF